MISSSGFNALTLAAVADACDLRRPSILHYFSSMDELLLAVISERDTEDFAAFREIADRYEVSAEGTRALYREVFIRNISRPQLVRLHVMLSVEALAPEHPAHETYKRREASARVTLEARLAWKRDPERAAAEFTAFWNGLEIVWTRDPSLDATGVFDTFCDRFFRLD